MSTQPPIISAILCSYNRAALLRRALQALCTQSLAAKQFEVLLIDDGSTDGTAAVATEFQQRLPLRYIHQPNAGLAAAKNHGIEQAAAPIVLFVDDDDIMDPDCLRQHLQSHAEHPQPQFAVLGYTDLLPEVARSPLMRYVTDSAGLLFRYSSLQHGDILDYRHFWGGRSSCKRGFLLEHGVFNPVFRFGAEDIELGYRLSTAGLRVVFNRQAISHMLRSLSFDDFCRRSYLQGRSNQVFATLHPSSAIAAYTGVDGAEQQWAQIEPRYPQLLKAGRDLHRYAIERVDAGLSIDGISTRLLQQAYDAAFRASQIAGIIASIRGDETTAPWES